MALLHFQTPDSSISLSASPASTHLTAKADLICCRIHGLDLLMQKKGLNLGSPLSREHITSLSRQLLILALFAGVPALTLTLIMLLPLLLDAMLTLVS